MTVRAHTMFTTFDPTSNAVITAATVNIYNPGTVTPISATIFDRLGNPLSNPLTSDATTGLIDFYLTVAQEVDVVVSKTGFTTRTYSNVPVLDDSSLELTALLTTTGDIPYASSANTPARLPIGTTNYILNVTGGVPKWTSAVQVSDANGTVGIGSAAGAAIGVTIGVSTTGATTQIGLQSSPTVSTGATTLAAGLLSNVTTPNSAFTCTSAAALFAQAPSYGAASTVTNSYGMYVANQGAAPATSAWGLYIAAQSGAANNYAIHAIGDCALGTASPAAGATAGFLYIPSNNNAPTGLPSAFSADFGGYAPMRFDTLNTKLWVHNGTNWKGVVLS